nr:hypothetical protein [uncultured Allomuricauda sp.]
MRLSFISFLLLTTIGFGQNEIQVYPALELLQQFEKVRDFTMTQKGNEAYFTIQSANEEVSVIASSTKDGNSWNTPQIASFSGEYKDLEPFLSPDGLQLYFVSNRPLNPSEEVKDFDIWFVKRSDLSSDWSEPINMGPPINSDSNEFYPAVSKNGNLYFTCDCPGAIGRDDIFYAENKNGTYTKPVALDVNINSEGFEYNAYISKDESYLLFGGYNRDDGQGSGDIYISYMDKQGNWSKAMPLPVNINSKHMDYCPYMDEINNILYFTSRRSINPTKRIESTQELSDFLRSYQNGSSRLYMAKIDLDRFKNHKTKS